MYIYTDTIHAELKILLHFIHEIKLNVLTLIVVTLFFTCFYIRAYASSIVLQLPPDLLKLTVNGLKRVSLKFISRSIGLT